MKRFYKTAFAEASGQAFAIKLDGRPVNTPARNPLIVQSQPLAEAIAAEWADQNATVDPGSMPLTKLATSVVDLMPARREDAVREIEVYGETDMLCYRVADPQELVLRQAKHWQPWLDWAAAEFEATLVATDTLTPVRQPSQALHRLRTQITRLTDWRLVGLHSAVRLTGSLVLGIAMERQALDATHAFDLANLEELFEIERWGVEHEQARRHAAARRDLLATQHYFKLLH